MRQQMTKEKTETTRKESKPTKQCECSKAAPGQALRKIRNEFKTQISDILNAPEDRRTKMLRTLYNELNQEA